MWRYALKRQFGRFGREQERGEQEGRAGRRRGTEEGRRQQGRRGTDRRLRRSYNTPTHPPALIFQVCKSFSGKWHLVGPRLNVAKKNNSSACFCAPTLARGAFLD